jgi:hypothetical protein
MYVGALWLKRRVADVNGFCPSSPDDLHHPPAQIGRAGPHRRAMQYRRQSDCNMGVRAGGT